MNGLLDIPVCITLASVWRKSRLIKRCLRTSFRRRRGNARSGSSLDRNGERRVHDTVKYTILAVDLKLVKHLPNKK
jgi:hypothetical protein